MGNLDLIGAVEAGEILGVSRDTVLRWSKPVAPRLHSVQLAGATGARVYERAEVLRLKAELDTEREQAKAATA